jgi:hypothetical protein
MLSNPQKVCADSVRGLPPADRLRLATLILNELTGAELPAGLIDGADAWSEEDRKDLTGFSLQYAATLYPETEDLV